jgi:hypothetical protein
MARFWSRSSARKLLLTAPTVVDFWRPGLPSQTPASRNRHIDLFCHLTPGHALVTELQDLLGGGPDDRRAAATHGDAGTPKLMAHGGPGNANSAPIRRRLDPGVHVGCTLNVHPRHRNGAVRKDVVGGPSYQLRRIGPADSLALRVRCSG